MWNQEEGKQHSSSNVMFEIKVWLFLALFQKVDVKWDKVFLPMNETQRFT